MTVAEPQAESKARGFGPSFTRLWGAALGSNLSDGFAVTAAPLLAATLTRDPVVISLVGVAQFCPGCCSACCPAASSTATTGAGSPPVACAVRAVVAAAVCVLVATDNMVVALLIAAVFVFGAFETVADGSIQAMVPAIVGREAGGRRSGPTAACRAPRWSRRTSSPRRWPACCSR